MIKETCEKIYPCPVCDSLSFTQRAFDRDFNHCICRVCKVHFGYDDHFAGLEVLGRKFLRQEWLATEKPADRGWQKAIRGKAFSFLATEYVALVTALRDAKQRVQAAEKVIDWYADESMWFTPRVCNDYLHGHSGHVCSKNWAFLGKYDGYDKAQAYRKRYPKDAALSRIGPPPTKPTGPEL